MLDVYPLAKGRITLYDGGFTEYEFMVFKTGDVIESRDEAASVARYMINVTCGAPDKLDGSSLYSIDGSRVGFWTYNTRADGVCTGLNGDDLAVCRSLESLSRELSVDGTVFIAAWIHRKS